MAEFKEQTPQEPRPERPRRNPRYLIPFALIGIFVVLVLSNLEALLKPIQALNTILVPIYMGLVLAYICNPFLRFFEKKVFCRLKRRRANRALSMLLTYVVLLLILAGIALLIIPQLIDSVNDLRYNGLSYVNRLIDSINGIITALPVELPGGADNLINLEKLLTFAMNLLGEYGSSLVGNLGNIAGSTLTFLKNLLVGVFVSIYLLLSKDRLYAGCRRVFRALLPSKNETMLLHYVRQANSKFGGFLIGKLVDSCMVGLTCALLFTIFKIPYPILIATIIGVTDFIPFFGPFIGAIPSAVIILIASPSKAILFVVLILVVQQIDGNLIAPLILGDHTGLTSLGVLIAITLMGGLFGFVGLLLGVPLFALVMTILDDYIRVRLRRKGSPTDLYSYYAADAFIRPSDEMEAEHATLTQKFIRWVSAVENEQPGVNCKRSPLRSLRMGLLKFGRFFHRMFAIKQLPEDRSNTQTSEIARRGMATNRGFWRALLLTVFSLGIYPLYLTEIISERANIACARDGKRTWGWLPVFLLGIVTLGIFPLIWQCGVICRFRRYAAENGKVCRTSLKFHLLWSTVGLLCVVGPFIAIARFLAAFNQMCRTFNETHTFPMSREELENEVANAAAYHAADTTADNGTIGGDEPADDFPWEVLEDLPDEVPPYDPTAPEEDTENHEKLS